MLKSPMKPERSLGSHPRENLNPREAGKRHWGPVRGDAAGFGYPEAEPTKFTSVAEGKKGSGRGARGWGGGARSPGRVKSRGPLAFQKIKKLRPGSRAGAEADGGLETRVDGAEQTEGRDSRAGRESLPQLRGHTHLVDPASPRQGAGSALLPPFGLLGEWAASGAPSNHAPPRDPRSQPPAPILPATHCARPQWTDWGPGRSDRGTGGAGARSLGGLWAWEDRQSPALRTRGRFREGGTRRAEFWEM